ncbi:CDP-alcohol phosphatidyltransferase family protein [Adhaeribacter sp. BT258]|uniref:CDP-alcohol phosphatidyltransferase family protein n=1 Tax=Adhaeribacter terrigena TaxID=2793070 RepID=A0ABS1BW84_9BACT|nr:CDP-alcohol phosphatidyltransferase family protein [Adhaeribacter terrigena]MBK0401350.1 CDP-alcohol phosphatidyltransferase family protein [Adhaeribacter terrigena]
MKKHIPNAITCLNLFCGCLAVYFTFHGNMVLAAYLVGLAAVLDFMDGMLARLLKAYSEIGKQLDSLADMVSFGFVPGVLMFHLLQTSLEGQSSFLGISPTVFPFFGFLITIFSALRLAKFNIDTRQTTSFIGMPTPACTIFVSSLPLILANDGFGISEIILNPFLLTFLTALLSYLLVAEIPLFALKFKNLTWKDNSVRFVFVIMAVLLTALFQFVAIPFIIALYILLSIIKPSYS